MSPRPYDMGRRRAASTATRVRILEAVRAILAGPGDASALSMESVAKRAGVSRMTVYYQFKSRAGLLDALADHLAEKGGMMGMGQAFTAADPDLALRAFVTTFVRFWSSAPETLRRMRALGVVYPELFRGPRDRDSWRREAAHRLLARQTAVGGAGGVPPAELADLLAALTAFETYDALAKAGRTPEEVIDLIVDAVRRLSRTSEAPAVGRARRRRTSS